MKSGASKLNLGKQSNQVEEIAAAAKRCIIHEPHLSVQRIWCDFDGGRLVLRGQVPSFYFKQLAQEAVADLEGVEQVVNEIEVLW
jgi:osmotically-inducible protein OsmY